MAETRAATLEALATTDPSIRRYISKISHGRVRREDVEDLHQQVLVRLLTKDYLQSYDPSKGAFSTFLYWPTRSVVVNRFAANGRDPLNRPPRPKRLARAEAGREEQLVSDTLQDLIDEGWEHRMVIRDLLARFRAYLDTRTKPWGPLITLPDGRRLRRSLGLVYELWITLGMGTRELAAALAVSLTTIWSYQKRLRTEAVHFSVAVGLT